MTAGKDHRTDATEFGQAAELGDKPDASKQRLYSLDAYRGLIMVVLFSGGFGLAATAGNDVAAHPDSGFWQVVHRQFGHVAWAGCTFWDLVQPSFMFMVGMSMAYSYAKRRKMGQSDSRMFTHAVSRSIILVLLSLMLTSNWSRSTNWSFANVLARIGLGYTFLFLLWRQSLRFQAIASVGILVCTWLLYVTYPGSGIDLQTGAPDAGVSADWAQQHLQGIDSAWHKNANVGHAIDRCVLNRFPRTEPFQYNRGGYQVINFIPSLATMLFGLMAGELLRSDLSEKRKLAVLVLAGIGGLAVGQVLHAAGICPLVKRIWTPSWALFSTGWCCLILAMLYTVIDIFGFRRWAFPLVVVGLNSIAAYCMGMLLKGWTSSTLKIHLGDDLFRLNVRLGSRVFSLVGEAHEATVIAWEPTIRATMVGLVFWAICWWMYRQKIFVRI